MRCSGKYSILGLVKSVSVLFIFVCTSTVIAAPGNKPFPVKPIVTVKQLQELNPKTRLLIDVRNKKKYQKAHIEKAIHVPIELSFNPTGNNSRIATISQAQQFLSSAGVKNSDYVVIYDNGDLKNAAHLFWLLETYGHKKVSVLAGGYPAWVAAMGKIAAGNYKRSPSNYIASISSSRLATRLSMRIAIENSGTQILDSRSESEYAGLSSKAKRKGHVPNAISIPWHKNFEHGISGNEIKMSDKLQELYTLLDKNKEVIAYCNRGKQSAVTYLILRNMGYRISVYDGGWLEWGNDPTLPVTTLTK